MEDQIEIHILWELEVIKADHNGYCSGAENEEEMYYEKIYCKYTINDQEYEILKHVKNNCPDMFQSEDFFDITRPVIENENVDCSGSGYCDSSENQLKHEIQRTPYRIIEIDTNNTLYYNIVNVD